jgi:hypothetical protein
VHDRHRMRSWTVTIHIFPDPFVGTSTAFIMVSQYSTVELLEGLAKTVRLERVSKHLNMADWVWSHLQISDPTQLIYSSSYTIE